MWPKSPRCMNRHPQVGNAYNNHWLPLSDPFIIYDKWSFIICYSRVISVYLFTSAKSFFMKRLFLLSKIMNVHQESSECDCERMCDFLRKVSVGFWYFVFARQQWKDIRGVMMTPDIPCNAGGESFLNAHDGQNSSDWNVFRATRWNCSEH